MAATLGWRTLSADVFRRLRRRWSVGLWRVFVVALGRVALHELLSSRRLAARRVVTGGRQDVPTQREQYVLHIVRQCTGIVVIGRCVYKYKWQQGCKTAGLSCIRGVKAHRGPAGVGVGAECRVMPPCSALSIGSVGAKCTFAQRKDGSQEGVDWRGHEVVVPGGAVLFGDGITVAVVGRAAQQQGAGKALQLAFAL